jgi:signal transduction histidine kinase
MPDLAWHRSLYWRIAIGLVAVIGLLLLAQGLLFVWLAGRQGGATPARSPGRLAAIVAADVTEELERDPALDLARFVREQYGHLYQPLFIVTAERQVYANRPLTPPPAVVDEAVLRLRRAQTRDDVRRGRRRYGEIGMIRVGGRPAAIVVVPPPQPLLPALRALGPIVATVAAVLLILGTAAVALLIFRPVRRRLGALEEAARAIGAGHTGVRAPEEGGDEVAALARTFNRMADDLGARARALREADRTRRQLLADISHELTTPLTAIRGYLETLAMPELSLDAPTRFRYLHIVGEETRRLETIVGDLLDLARLEGVAAPLASRSVAVDALFRRVADRHERALREQGIELEMRIDATLPVVEGDPDRLEQVLQNLAANAVRHMPKGGRLVLSAEPASDGVTITVRDTGPGIPPDHLPHLFDRFYKVDAARSVGAGGSGLGLSIVKAIVERHGGTVTAGNAPDGGAVFTVTLPRAPG